MDTIVNPETGKHIYLYSDSGLQILNQYMNTYKGGSKESKIDELFKLLENGELKCAGSNCETPFFPENFRCFLYRMLPAYLDCIREVDKVEKRNMATDIIPKIDKDGEIIHLPKNASNSKRSKHRKLPDIELNKREEWKYLRKYVEGPIQCGGMKNTDTSTDTAMSEEDRIKQMQDIADCQARGGTGKLTKLNKDLEATGIKIILKKESFKIEKIKLLNKNSTGTIKYKRYYVDIKDLIERKGNSGYELSPELFDLKPLFNDNNYFNDGGRCFPKYVDKGGEDITDPGCTVPDELCPVAISSKDAYIKQFCSIRESLFLIRPNVDINANKKPATHKINFDSKYKGYCYNCGIKFLNRISEDPLCNPNSKKSLSKKYKSKSLLKGVTSGASNINKFLFGDNSIRPICNERKFYTALIDEIMTKFKKERKNGDDWNFPELNIPDSIKSGSYGVDGDSDSGKSNNKIAEALEVKLLSAYKEDEDEDEEEDEEMVIMAEKILPSNLGEYKSKTNEELIRLLQEDNQLGTTENNTVEVADIGIAIVDPDESPA